MITKFKIFEKKDNIYFPKNLGEYIYHQTNIKDALNIIKNGFEYGYELDRGERDYGIFFSATFRGQEGASYNRGNTDKKAMVEVSTRDLKLFDTDWLEEDKTLLSYQQPWFIMVRNVKDKNIFPDGYDGIINRNRGNIYEIILKKEVANKNLTGRLMNLKGKYYDN